jgi:hypothetical protein
MPFAARFTITNAITAALTAIERARGFLEAAALGGLDRRHGHARKDCRRKLNQLRPLIYP